MQNVKQKKIIKVLKFHVTNPITRLKDINNLISYCRNEKVSVCTAVYR